MSRHMRSRSFFGLAAGLAVTLAGCASPVPVAAPAMAPPMPFTLEAVEGPEEVVVAAAGVPIPGSSLSKADHGRAGLPLANAPMSLPVSSAGSGGGMPLPLPAVPARINQHALDRVAGTPVTEGPLAEPFRQVSGVAVDPVTKMVFACDPLRHQIRAIAPDGRSWIVAGSATSTHGFDGERLPATASRLSGPVGLAFDVPSGALLVADGGNRRIRYLQPGGLMYTLAGGGTDTADSVAQARDAAIGEPFGVASDAYNHTWFTERDTGKVRRVTGAGQLETVVTLPSGRAGAIAVQASTSLVWVTDDHTVYMLDPAVVPVQAVPIYAPKGVRITAMAHDQRDALILTTTSDATPGTAETRIWRIPLGLEGGLALGNRAEWLAGKGASSTVASDYVLPIPTVPDATQQRLGGAGYCGLAVDWTRQSEFEGASGLIYAGTSFVGAQPASSHAEVFRLTPRMGE